MSNARWRGSFNEMTDRLGRILQSPSASSWPTPHTSCARRSPGLRLRLEVPRRSTRPSRESRARRGDPRGRPTLAHRGRAARTEPRRRASGDGSGSDLRRRRRRFPLACAAARARSSSYHGTSRADPVWAARPDVERALDVLLENAVNYSPVGTVRSKSSPPRGIEVRDRGPGLADEEREAVFERFHRGRAGRAGPPGSGLGLAIARELARAWSGDVTIKDRDGGGSVATWSFPLRSADPRALPSLKHEPTRLV